jgi:hypothetical protein
MLTRCSLLCHLRAGRDFNSRSSIQEIDTCTRPVHFQPRTERRCNFYRKCTTAFWKCWHSEVRSHIEPARFTCVCVCRPVSSTPKAVRAALAVGNVLFFERKSAAEKPGSASRTGILKFWIFDLRTNKHLSVKGAGAASSGAVLHQFHHRMNLPDC